MQSCFAFAATFNPTSRLFDPAQAGGALLDLGIYNLNITRWALQNAVALNALGACPLMERMVADAVWSETGVDMRTAATLHFAGGVTSQFTAAVDCAGANDFVIAGASGSITIHRPFSSATQATLARVGESPVTIKQPHRINGFEGEIEEAMRCIRAGKFESEIMSHADTLDAAKWMDQIRAIIGLRYPFDKPPTA
jgi:predicted dehydrogenase